MAADGERCPTGSREGRTGRVPVADGAVAARPVGGAVAGGETRLIGGMPAKLGRHLRRVEER